MTARRPRLEEEFWVLGIALRRRQEPPLLFTLAEKHSVLVPGNFPTPEFIEHRIKFASNEAHFAKKAKWHLDH